MTTFCSEPKVTLLYSNQQLKPKHPSFTVRNNREIKTFKKLTTIIFAQNKTNTIIKSSKQLFHQLTFDQLIEK